jgi:hypothetical protein
MLSGKKKVKKAAILLAFNRHVATDVARTKEMEKKYSVYTVSRVEEPGREDHLHAHFSDIGKPKSMILDLVRAKVLQHTKVSLFLDYWWPAIGYFADAYGVWWLSLWVRLILEAGAFEVFLPHCAEVQKMEEDLNALVGIRIQKGQSPLWCATESTPGISSEFNAKKMLGLTKKTPFLRFRKGRYMLVNLKML